MGQGDVRRVHSVFDLPDASLRCAAIGRHVGFGAEDPRVRDVGGWPGHRAGEVHYDCDCGRWKEETIDLDTGEMLSRGAQYGGGVLLWLGSSPSRDEARAVYLARVRARAEGKGVPNQGGITHLNDRRSS